MCKEKTNRKSNFHVYIYCQSVGQVASYCDSCDGIDMLLNSILLLCLFWINGYHKYYIGMNHVFHIKPQSHMRPQHFTHQLEQTQGDTQLVEGCFSKQAETQSRQLKYPLFIICVFPISSHPYRFYYAKCEFEMLKMYSALHKMPCLRFHWDLYQHTVAYMQLQVPQQWIQVYGNTQLRIYSPPYKTYS